MFSMLLFVDVVYFVLFAVFFLFFIVVAVVYAIVVHDCYRCCGCNKFSKENGKSEIWTHPTHYLPRHFHYISVFGMCSSNELFRLVYIVFSLH